MQIYVVQQGDTLWRISQSYGVDINQVILGNALQNPNALVSGQSLLIPNPNQEYIVQPGDTLYGIAQQFGVDFNDLTEINQITDPYTIYVGEWLKLPYIPHIVQSKETMWSISQQYGVSINEISQANGISDPSRIFPGQVLYIPAPIQPTVEVNAYTTNTGQSGANEVRQLGRNFTYLSPFMHAIQEDGSVTALDDQAVLAAAQENEIAPLFVLTNYSGTEFSPELAATILQNPDLQEKVITNVLDQMEAKGYEGINIDFEYVNPEDRENYNAFLRRVAERLRPRGYLISTAVAPKISGEMQGQLYAAHDYAAHGEILDFVIIMTYEWGWAGSYPRAIAPIHRVQAVLDYAVTVIPPEKILMGVPLYGRKWEIPWVEGTFAQTVNPQEAIALATSYNVPIQYDEESQAPFFRYTDESGQRYEVWFEDARSIQAKYDTLKDYNLRGASYWVLGNPFPQNWPVLRNNFRVKKL